MQDIFVNVTIKNQETGCVLRLRALVDTGAKYIVLPMRFKTELGHFCFERTESVTLADGSKTEMLLCGPVVTIIEGFLPAAGEIHFCESGIPLLGHWQLQVSRALVDTVNHCLIPDTRAELCVGCRVKE